MIVITSSSGVDGYAERAAGFVAERGSSTEDGLATRDVTATCLNATLLRSTILPRQTDHSTHTQERYNTQSVAICLPSALITVTATKEPVRFTGNKTPWGTHELIYDVHFSRVIHASKQAKRRKKRLALSRYWPSAVILEFLPLTSTAPHPALQTTGNSPIGTPRPLPDTPSPPRSPRRPPSNLRPSSPLAGSEGGLSAPSRSRVHDAGALQIKKNMNGGFSPKRVPRASFAKMIARHSRNK